MGVRVLTKFVILVALLASMAGLTSGFVLGVFAARHNVPPALSVVDIKSWIDLRPFFHPARG
jgi:hypothetical protein